METKYLAVALLVMARVSEAKLGGFMRGELALADAIRLERELSLELGIEPSEGNRKVLHGLVAIRLGLPAKAVAGHLGWRDFESFCAALFRARGYDVRENLYLRKPRAQVDVVAIGPSRVVSVDCKHWRRDHGPSALSRIALAQKMRSQLLRKVIPGEKPILSVILSLSAPSGDFVDGVAVVPIGALRDFMDALDSVSDRFDPS